MLPTDRKVTYLLLATIAIVAALGLGACSRSQSATDSLTGPGHGGATPFNSGHRNNPKPPPPPPPPPPPAPGVTLSAVSVNPVSVVGGLSSSAGTVTLTGAAPAGGLIVSLTSSSAAAVVPASVTVAAGATTAGFTATTSAVTVSTAVTITATGGGVALSALLTVTPPVSPCVSLIGKSGTVVNVAASVPQFRLTRLRVDVVGDVALGYINTLGACTATAAPAVNFISGTCNLTRNGVSVTATGAPLSFGALTVPIIIEPGVVLATDAAGNVLQIIWPALAGLPPGPPVLRFNLAQRDPSIATGDVLDATMTYVARAPDGSTATFNVAATGMVVPVLQ